MKDFALRFNFDYLPLFKFPPLYEQEKYSGDYNDQQEKESHHEGDHNYSLRHFLVFNLAPSGSVVFQT